MKGDAVTFEEALTLIKSFWAEPRLPFGGGDPAQVSRIQGKFPHPFPAELLQYVARYAPAHRFSFEAVGDPIAVYSSSGLSSKADGYNWNPLTQEALNGWSADWVLVGDQGGDPIIIDLTTCAQLNDPCPVLQAPHGAGKWSFQQLAPSLPTFAVLVAAQHHALTAFVHPSDIISVNRRGFRRVFNLHDRVAGWYFPFVRRVAPEHYTIWAGVFDNA